MDKTAYNRYRNVLRDNLDYNQPVNLEWIKIENIPKQLEILSLFELAMEDLKKITDLYSMDSLEKDMDLWKRKKMASISKLNCTIREVNCWHQAAYDLWNVSETSKAKELGKLLTTTAEDLTVILQSEDLLQKNILKLSHAIIELPLAESRLNIVAENMMDYMGIQHIPYYENKRKIKHCAKWIYNYGILHKLIH